MNRKVPLNQWLYKALIEKEMDGFSVLEIRNSLLEETAGQLDKHELRKMLYRQIINWLIGVIWKNEAEKQTMNPATSNRTDLAVWRLFRQNAQYFRH